MVRRICGSVFTICLLSYSSYTIILHCSLAVGNPRQHMPICYWRVAITRLFFLLFCPARVLSIKPRIRNNRISQWLRIEIIAICRPAPQKGQSVCRRAVDDEPIPFRITLRVYNRTATRCHDCRALINGYRDSFHCPHLGPPRRSTTAFLSSDSGKMQWRSHGDTKWHMPLYPICPDHMGIVEIRVENMGGAMGPVGQNAAFSSKKEPQSLWSDTFTGLEIFRQCFCDRDCGVAPLGSLQRSPMPSTWIWGPFRGGREEWKEREKKGKKKGGKENREDCGDPLTGFAITFEPWLSHRCWDSLDKLFDVFVTNNCYVYFTKLIQRCPRVDPRVGSGRVWSDQDFFCKLRLVGSKF